MATGGDASVPIQITSKAYKEFLLHQHRLFQGYSRRRRSSSFEDIVARAENDKSSTTHAGPTSVPMPIIRPVRKSRKVRVNKIAKNKNIANAKSEATMARTISAEVKIESKSRPSHMIVNPDIN